MTRYTSEAEAAADGIRIRHEPEHHRFALLLGEDRVGEAHYTLQGGTSSTGDASGADRGAPGDAATGGGTDEGAGRGGIEFDHTFVVPELRGTGLSRLLARHALTDPFTRGRRISASCWFIAGYLRRHPELQGDTGR